MEFDINGVDYRATKLSVFDQLKVCRKLLPVLSSIVPDLAKLRETAAATAGDRENLSGDWYYPAENCRRGGRDAGRRR
jgi:hypothetical protein